MEYLGPGQGHDAEKPAGLDQGLGWPELLVTEPK